MALRKILLRIMLGSLGVAAALGVLAILTPALDGSAQIVAMAVITAGAASIMLPLSLLVDRPRLQAAGMLGLIIVMVEYLFGLALVWTDYRFSNRIGLTLLFVAAIGVPAMILLLFRSIRVARLAVHIGVGILAVCLVVLLGAAWWYSWTVRERCFVLGFSWAGLSLPVIGCLVGIGCDRRHWRYIGLIAMAVVFVLVPIAIFGHNDSGWSLLVGLISLAVALAHANLALRIPLKSNQHWLATGAIIATVTTAVSLSAAAVPDDLFGNVRDAGLLYPLAAAAGIVACCGTLALLVLALLNRKVQTRAQPHDLRQITLQCPRCDRKQTLAIGDGVCAGCGLRIHTAVHEPRCPNCDYLLYGLSSDRCPECGTPISPTGATPIAANT